MIFGPALNRAHEIEAKEAVFPRIICDDPVIELLRPEPEFEQEAIIDARDGRRIVNFYRPVFANVPAYVRRQFLDDFYHFHATMEVIAENMLLVANDARTLGKWIYMRDYVEMGKQRLLSFIGES